MSETSGRKEGHLELFRHGHPGAGVKTTLFEEVELIPEPLPQLALDQVDTRVDLLGKGLSVPLMLTGMTGGTAQAGELNRQLARLAAEFGLALGVGSQRAMLEEPDRAASYRLREVTGPSTLLIANVGIGQVPELSVERARWLVEAIEADALAVHLNVAQELVQQEGDRDFRGTEAALAALVESLEVPVLVKEVGSGISRPAAERFVAMGVGAMDVAGAGGTSWTYAEGLRGDSRAQRLGDTFRDWGIPTAAAVLQLQGVGVPLIASGGIRTGLEVAKAIALGASVCGVAGPVIRSLMNDGLEEARWQLGLLLDELRVTMVLTGSAAVGDLAGVRRVIGPGLQSWDQKP